MSDNINERSDAWKMILHRNCKKELAQLRREYPKTKSLIIPYTEVQRFGSVGLSIADDILEFPGAAIEDVRDCIRDHKLVETDKGNGAKDITPRFIKLPKKITIKDIRERHIDTLLAIEVQVKRVGEILPRTIDACFRCPAGHFTHKKQPYNTWAVPDGCATDGCTFKKLEYIPKRSTSTDTQRVLVQEILDNAHGGEQPKTMHAELMGDLCGTIFPGDRVIINAILRSYQISKGGQLSPVFRTYLDVNSIEIFLREYEEVEIAEEDEKIIKTLAKEKDILQKVARSIAPSVYGMEPFKQAIALALFSGKQSRNQYGETKRMDIHVLGCGDPALAKSKVARYAVKVAPRSVMTSGLSSSKAGLTVSVTRDETDGRWVADAGAMCLADGGLFFLDELGDLPKPDQAILHEAMEEQESHYAKAGLVGSYNTRCSVISCMNPKHGRFDIFSDLQDQVDVKSALISRFDLVYLMTDVPEQNYDKGVANAILEDDDPKPDAPKRDDIITVDLLRKYIAYSKKQKNPSLTDEAKKVLSDYYLKVRGVAKQGQPIPITARAMDTLKRLSVSHAKMRLSDVVAIKDAELAVKVLDESLKNTCIDPSTGQRDIDRVSGGKSAHKRNMIGVIKEIVKGEPGLSLSLLVSKMDERSFKNENEVKEVVKDMVNKGDLMEPRYEHYRVM